LKLNRSIFRFSYLALQRRYVFPKIFLKDINDLEIDVLRSHSIQGVVFDIDQTLSLPNENKINERVLNSFLRIQSAFKVCALSNLELAMSSEAAFSRGLEFERLYNLRVILPKLKKPHPSGFRLARRYLNLKPPHIAFIGDRLLTDTIGANYSRFYSIQVAPLDITADEPTIRIFRRFENLILHTHNFFHPKSSPTEE